MKTGKNKFIQIRKAWENIEQPAEKFSKQIAGADLQPMDVLPDRWVEIEWAPGYFARQVPLKSNGMSIIVWEAGDVFDTPEHTHTQDETFHIVRGRLDLEVRNEDGSIIREKLTPLSAPYNVGKRTKHRELMWGGSVIISVYTPAITIKEALAVKEKYA